FKNFKIGQLMNEQKEQLTNMVLKYDDICMYGEKSLKQTSVVKHRINLKKEVPDDKKKLKAYRENKENRKIIQQEVASMLKAGIIRKSYSPWSSPVVLVGKKSGKKRFCIDYRKLNTNIKIDAYPISRIDDLLEKFRVSKWFTTIDLANRYWQIEIEEEDKEKTAFVCSQGLFEFNVMPFGLTNAPATFQRAMNKTFREYIDKFIAIYLDDIIIFSKTFQEHIQHVETVLKKLNEVNMMLKLKKCKWAENNIEFLGHIVGKDGIKPDPAKIEKIKKLKIPQNVSKIAKPINQLLQKEIKFKWKEKQQEAFEKLKQKLINHPILIYPNYQKPFLVITDASGIGLGAVLAQENDKGNEGVIMYASRSLTPAEKNYPITELECLAVVWAIEQFHKYLISQSFTVITDHNALKELMTSKVPSGRRARWIMKLQ